MHEQCLISRRPATPGTRVVLCVTLLAALLVLTSSNVRAESRWYQVEVIIFRYTNPTGGEQAVAPRQLPNFANAISLVSDVPNFDDEPEIDRADEASIAGPTAFQSLSSAELQLGGVLRRLRTLDTYAPVLHVGWRQPGLGDGRARYVYLTDKPRSLIDARADDDVAVGSVQVAEQRVEGMVRVKTGVGLQVDADFISYGADAPVRINERRNVKFKEVHYFDNPFFGVIIQVVPYRIVDPNAPAGDAASTE